MKHTSSSGFTLIELMVVISIIGLMTSVALLGLQGARQKAAAAKATGNMNSLRTALQLYQTTYGDWPSNTSDGRMSISNKTAATWAPFFAKISPFMPALVPDIQYAEISGPPSAMTQGFLYLKGNDTSATPYQVPINSRSQSYVYLGCIKIYDGYYFSEIWPQTNQLTMYDNGFDPDGIDHYDGHVEFHPEVTYANCQANY